VVELDDRSCITSRKQLKEQDHHNDGDGDDDDDDDEVDYVLFPGETISPPKPLQHCVSVNIANKQFNVWSTIYENCSTDQPEDDAASLSGTVVVSFYEVMPKCIKGRF